MSQYPEQTVIVQSLPTPVPVTATAPVSVQNFPNPLNIQGTVSINNIPSTQIVNGSVSINNFPSSQNVNGLISIDLLTGRTPKIVSGFIGTTTTTSNQVICTYTVPASKTFYLQYFEASVRLSTFAGTQMNFGQLLFNSPAGIHFFDTAGPGFTEMNVVSLSQPLPFSTGSVLSWTVNPASTTGLVWEANFGGYLL